MRSKPIKDSKGKIISLKLTEDPSDGQGQMRWNGNYKKHLVHLLRTQAMGRSKLTILNQTLLTKLEKSLLKLMETTGTKRKHLPKQLGKFIDIEDKDTER